MLIGGGIDVHTFLSDANALFLLLLACLLGLLFALLALLFLRFLLRASALVQRVEVYLALNFQLRGIGQLLVALQLEHLRAFFLRLFLRLLGSGFLFRCGLGGRLRFLFLQGLLLLRFGGLCLRLLLGGWGSLRGFLLLFFLRRGAHGSSLRRRSRLLLGSGGSLWGSLGFRGFLGFGLSLGLGGSLGLLFGRSLLLGSRLQRVEVNLAQRLEQLLRRRLQQALTTCVLRLGLLLLRLLLEQFLGLRAYFLVLLESSHKGVVLSVIQLEARLGLHLSQFTLLFQKLHCRLESYVQFT